MDKKAKNQDEITANHLAPGTEAKAVEVSKTPQDVGRVNPELPDSPGKDKKEPNVISVSNKIKLSILGVYLVIVPFC
jgi:hypothetical protein